jgi:hypothetical protein
MGLRDMGLNVKRMKWMLVKKKIRLMSLDPSINNLGMAIWDLETKTLLMHKLLHPLKDAKENEYEKSYSMLMQLKKWNQTYGVNKVICEVPEHWSVSGFEARETGSIAKLCFVCGLIYSLRCEVDEMKVVTPREWKGQLPKSVVANRLYEEYIKKYNIDMIKMNQNVMDAVGIGHFYLYGSV